MAEHLISFDEASEDLLAAAAYIGEAIKSSDGHAEAMLAVVPRYLDRGEVDMAAELANSVDDPFTRDRLLIRVAEKCAELDDDEYALQLAEAVEDRGMQAEAFESVALQKAAKGQLEKAAEIAATMEHPDYVYAGIAVKQSVEGADADAAETLENIEYPRAEVYALQNMAASRIAEGKIDEAVALTEQAVAAAGEIDHAEELIRALVELGHQFVEEDRREKAVETFEMAAAEADKLDNIHRDSFLAMVSLGFLNADRMDLADGTLDRVADKTQIASALVGMARYLWKTDERDEAVEALEEAYSVLKSQRDNETRSAKARFELFATISAQFAGFEKGERAIEIAQEIASETEQMTALTQIAQVLTIRKQDDLARQSLAAIPDEGQRVFALIGMSDSAEKNGERERAVELLDEAASLNETVMQPSVKSSAYYEISRRYMSFGNAERAAEATDLNLQTIASIRDESIRAVNLAALSDIAHDGVAPQDTEIVKNLVRQASL